MSSSSPSGIKVRPVSQKRLVTEIDTSTGINYNGTTNTVPTKGLVAPIQYERFYLADGEELPEVRKRAMIELEESIIAMLPPEDHKKAREQIAEYRTELGIKHE